MRTKSQLIVGALLWIGWLPTGTQHNSSIDSSVSDGKNNKDFARNSKVSTGNERSPNMDKSRQSRIFTFNNDESNIRVELNFAVPFLQIPVGGGQGQAGNRRGGRNYPLIDVNTNSLITTSVVMFMLIFIVPKLVHILMPNTLSHSRLSTGNEEDELTQRIDRILSHFQLDSKGACRQRSVCHIVQNASARVLQSEATSWDKIIDGFVRNSIFHYLTQGTGVYEGAMSGLSVKQCQDLYSTCTWDVQKAISSLNQVTAMFKR